MHFPIHRDSLISLGVKQGEPLSPILFILFVNDIHKEMSDNIIAMRILNKISIFILMQADNIALFAILKQLHKLLGNLNLY